MAEVEHDSWIALLSVVGTGLFVLLAAWIGGKYTQRFRGEDLYKDIGRLEGRGTEDVGPRGSFEFAMMLGGLKTGVETLQEDVDEIKTRQEANRDRQDKNISDISTLITTIHSDMSVMKQQFADLRRSVANLARSVHDTKKPRGSSPS